MRKELRRNLRIRELQLAYARAKSDMPSVEVPSHLRLVLEGSASFDPEFLARPMQAAWISAASFATFAVVPIAALLVAPAPHASPAIAAVSLL